MAQIFHRSTNTLARASIFGAGLVAVGIFALGYAFQRSSYVTGVNIPRHQTVPFSHQHHVQGVGLDCRYCHTSVEESSFAGIPPTQTCMNCHSQIWTEAPVLEPVRQSWKTGQPLEWVRVHDLADFVYFPHNVHVAKGVACVTCHGRVDRMALTWKSNSLYMEWCLGCHRDPAKYLSPADAVFRMDAEPPEDPEARGQELMKQNQVHTRTDCSTCHR
ncbi:MAG: cytochrome c3 family protein [bacterium]